MTKLAASSPSRRDVKVHNKPAKRAVRCGAGAGTVPPAAHKHRADLEAVAHALPLNQVLTGDCEAVMRTWPANSVDLIVTSPPYNFGMEYHGNGDTLHWDEYFAKLRAVFAECARVLVPGGRIAVNVQPLFSDYMPTHHHVATLLRELGLLFKAEILWEKHNYNCKYTAWGSWRSPSMPYFKYTWEFVEVFCKGQQKKAPRVAGAISDLTGDEFKKWVYAKWEIAPAREMNEYDHPAMFPEELVARLIKLLSFPGDVVVDPFNGVGTTCVVAQRLRRAYIGIDISPHYCATAQRRLREAHPELAL